MARRAVLLPGLAGDGDRRSSMVKRKRPSPKAKKAIVKRIVKDAKKLRSAYAKGQTKKFQAAFGRLSGAMMDVDPHGGKNNQRSDG
jgi:hypothetical protein